MINKSEFDQQIFTIHGIIEEDSKEGLNRVPNGWMPTNSNSTDLREKIRDVFWEKTEEYHQQKKIKISDYDVIELCCRIPTDTMKKAMNGKYKVTRRFLAKYAVGLKLGISRANDLFSQHSGELNLSNDFDYIVYHALKTKDDINYFINEVYEFLKINLDNDKA